MLSVFKTSDGSDTIYDNSKNAYYHSVYGAITESQHVFIENGLKRILHNYTTVRIFEVGFGTGLNAYLSYLFAEPLADFRINYTAIEKHPLPESIYTLLNYPKLLNEVHGSCSFIDFHKCPWNQSVALTEKFVLEKIKGDFRTWIFENQFDLIYMDAFSPNDDPDLWTDSLLEKYYNMLVKDGLLTTYCAKGSFKRSLKRIGFKVECVPGPHGKREMTLAYK